MPSFYSTEWERIFFPFKLIKIKVGLLRGFYSTGWMTKSSSFLYIFKRKISLSMFSQLKKHHKLLIPFIGISMEIERSMAARVPRSTGHSTRFMVTTS